MVLETKIIGIKEKFTNIKWKKVNKSYYFQFIFNTTVWAHDVFQNIYFTHMSTKKE